MKKLLKSTHQTVFKEAAEQVYFAPSCINLLGDHTDYTGGKILSFALDEGTYLSVSKRTDTIINWYDKESEVMHTFDISEPNLTALPLCLKLTYAFIDKLAHEGYKVTHGFNFVYADTIPQNAGFSSRASQEVCLVSLLTQEMNITLDPHRLIKYCQIVDERVFDHYFVSYAYYPILLAKKDHALYVNIKTKEIKHIPLNLKDYTFTLFNSNKKRNFEEHDMRDRIKTIKEGSKTLCNHVRCESLGDITLNEFNRIKGQIKNQRILKRIEHVVFENERVDEAVTMIEDHEYVILGDLMDQSHQSLKKLLEVTCAEIDYIHEYMHTKDALGVRQTGLGFGGCVLALFEKESDIDFAPMQKEYEKRFKKACDIIPLKTSDGAHKL